MNSTITKKTNALFSRLKSLQIRFSTKDQMFFAKRLSFLINGNIPILESLHLLRDQSTSRQYKKMLKEVVHDVSNGQTLSKSLAKFPHYFGEFAVNIISIGESSGLLSQNLNYLAEELSKKQALRRKVLGAFIYPIFIIVATIAITVFLTVYLFPKILPVFLSLHITLPLTTQAVIWTSAFLKKWGLLLFVVTTLLIIAFLIALKQSTRIHRICDTCLLKTPVLGKLLKCYSLANACRTIGLLLNSGMTMGSAMSITAHVSSNMVYQSHFDQMSQIINRGEQLSTYFKKYPELFGDTFCAMVVVGEHSGNLPNAFLYLAELYQTEVEDFTKELAQFIEPLMMIFMGIFVGFIAISIITPIYSISQHLSGR